MHLFTLFVCKQQQQVQRSPISGALQQISPLSLVTHNAAQNAHHRLLGGPSMGQMPNLMQHEIEQRMIEYLKLLQNPKDTGRSQSPDSLSRAEALNALEMSRVALWSMYNNNPSPPASVNTTSPPNMEPQREALNLSESPTHSVKRERDNDVDYSDRDDRDYGLPVLKKLAHSSLHQLPSHLGQSQQHLSPHSHHYSKHEHRRRSTTPPSPNIRNASGDRGHNHHHHHHNNNNNHHSSSSSSARRRMSSSPQRNGMSSSLNGSSEPLNVGSPISILSGMQFKLFSRGMYFSSINECYSYLIQVNLTDFRKIEPPK